MVHQDVVRENGLWIISDDAALCECAEQELKDECPIRRISSTLVHSPSFWRGCGCYPGVILLDIGDRVDWGVQVLRAIKRARVPSPVIVTSETFSKEFGTKIVSEGVSYCLQKGFECSELREVVVSLIKPLQDSGSESS
jgi:DNA-binding NarL/FixJ family response regulator